MKQKGVSAIHFTSSMWTLSQFQGTVQSCTVITISKLIFTWCYLR